MYVSAIARNDGRRKHAHDVPRVVKVDPRDVESAPDIGPVGWPDHAFVPKSQGLATPYNIHPAFCGIAYLRVTFPKGPSVLVRVGVGSVMIEKDASILDLGVKAQPLLGLNCCLYPQAIQQVEITSVVVANTDRTLDAIPIFASDADPAWQGLVEFGDRKQPTWGIIDPGRAGRDAWATSRARGINRLATGSLWARPQTE